MDKPFLEYYKENLTHIRGIASEFAAEFPKIAARLELSSFDCQDPYIERLLEGTAFLAARVEKKLSDGFPRLLETLLSAAAPFLLSPIPASTIVELQLNNSDERLKKGFLLPSGSVFHCTVPGIKTKCSFSTIHSQKIFPLALTEAEYLTRDLESFGISDPGAQSALRLKIKRTDSAPLSGIQTDSLDVYLNFPENEASVLQSLLLSDDSVVYVRSGEKAVRSPSLNIGIPNFSNDNDLVPLPFHQLRGVRLLQQFFAYPASFKYFRIDGLKTVFPRLESPEADLLFVFRRRETSFLHSLTRDSFKLWCLPLLNVFHKNSDRCEVEGQYEFHVVPDRTSPTDYEIFFINEVETYNDRNESLFLCRNFYDEAEIAPGKRNRNFFCPHRRVRLVNNSRSSRTSYYGSEVFLSFSGEDWREQRDKIRQFRADMWCTNRDLPLLLRFDTDFQPPEGSVISKSKCIVSPSRPQMPLVHEGGIDWRMTGHLSFNLSSSLWGAGGVPLEIIRGMLRLYSCRTVEETERIVDGISSIVSVPKVFRFIEKGCVFFENGWRIDITLNEQNYAGVGGFIFSYVLKELLESYTPLNTFVEIAINYEQQRNVKVWKIQRKQSAN